MANYKQESGLSIYLCICINAPEGCQLSIYLFPTNRFIGAERPFELRVMSNHPRRAVLYSTCRSGTRATTHADGWFHEWIHTLEYGPQWWERPCASHPGHDGLRHYTLVRIRVPSRRAQPPVLQPKAELERRILEDAIRARGVVCVIFVVRSPTPRLPRGRDPWLLRGPGHYATSRSSLGHYSHGSL